MCNSLHAYHIFLNLYINGNFKKKLKKITFKQKDQLHILLLHNNLDYNFSLKEDFYTSKLSKENPQTTFRCW